MDKAAMTMTAAKTNPSRNYQLDFLKLVFTFFLIFQHSSVFVGENTRITIPPMMGAVTVHFFFIVSGMLMANSIVKKEPDILSSGRSAMQFVLNKLKNILLQYWSALLVFMTIYIYICTTLQQSKTFLLYC
ncbi:MAG: acyltransferase family protein [Oscillospiraceae bacterium]|nr:acyltransferase family protein [Oscillospiraceae bacterium]